MYTLRLELIFFLLFTFISCNANHETIVENDDQKEQNRDPLKQPFSSTSIWNTPIGSNAVYVHADLEKAIARGMTIDEDLIVLKPNTPQTEIYTNNAGWSRKKDRCIKDGPFLFSAPIPDDFTVSPKNRDGDTPNSELAVLIPDGRTIKQTQSFARCTAGKSATSKYVTDNTYIYGEGYYGVHGSSGLSAIGGALRVGELISEDKPIKHVLKINVFGKKNLYYDETTKGFRWPAKRADGYAQTIMELP